MENIPFEISWVLLGQTLAPNHLELFFVVLVGESSGCVGMKSWIFDPGSRTNRGS